MNWRVLVTFLVVLTASTIQRAPLARATDNPRDDETVAAFRFLTKGSTWKLVNVVKMDFVTHHTQGLVKIGDTFYVSAVEFGAPRILTGTTDALHDASTDRTPGTGRGWLHKFNGEGALLDQVEITEETIYHPGGLDYDGESIWVAVAEYRPNSNSIVYRVHPETLAVEEVFRVRDHIGGIVHNVQNGTLHGVSWGSRRMYTWTYLRTADGQIRIQSENWVPNPVHYIDYQDCHAVGSEYMLCSGLNQYDTPAGTVALGGIDLVNLRGEHPRPEHQLPIQEYADDRPEATLETWAPSGPELVVSNNPFWAEPIAHGEPVGLGKKLMRFYFMPERDNQADLLIYEVATRFLPRNE
jgi:Family of unknown function (DUF6454)